MLGFDWMPGWRHDGRRNFITNCWLIGLAADGVGHRADFTLWQGARQYRPTARSRRGARAEKRSGQPDQRQRLNSRASLQGRIQGGDERGPVRGTGPPADPSVRDSGRSLHGDKMAGCSALSHRHIDIRRLSAAEIWHLCMKGRLPDGRVLNGAANSLAPPELRPAEGIASSPISLEFFAEDSLWPDGSS